MSYAEDLGRRMWITKKARMEAATRLETYDSRCQFLQLWYSIGITAASVWNFGLERGGSTTHSQGSASVILLIVSIASTILSTFILSKAYRERSINMRHNYIEIDKLISRLNRDSELAKNSSLTTQEFTDNVHKISDEYTAILGAIENHSTEDYLMARSSMQEPLNGWKKVHLFLLQARTCLLYWLLLVGPVGAVIYYALWRR